MQTLPEEILELEAADAAYDAAVKARVQARDTAELEACQKLLPLLQPDHLTALARNAVAHNIRTNDVSAIGFLACPENCVNGAIEKLLKPVHKKYCELLKNEQQIVKLDALEKALEKALDRRTKARTLPTNVAAADLAAKKRSEAYSPHIGGGFADDEMYIH